MTNISIIKSIAIEHTIPHEFTSTGAWNIIPYNSHGIGKLKIIQNIQYFRGGFLLLLLFSLEIEREEDESGGTLLQSIDF